MKRQVWVDIDLKALSCNLKTVRQVVGRAAKIIAVIKQAAYGHGLIPMARRFYAEGVDYFGVGSIEEAVALREDGYRGSILFLSAAPAELAAYFVRFNIIPAVVDEQFARELNRQGEEAGKIIPVHIKVDTGMGRLGLYPEQIYSFLEELERLEYICLEGIYTHFPVADSNSDFTRKQVRTFQNLIRELEKKNIKFRYHHCANSLGVIDYPDSCFNMVRPGLILYGLKPSAGLKINLEPVLSFRSKVIFVKEVPCGGTVGYGADFVAETKKRIATVSVGYADGYPWRASNRARVLIGGKIFKIAGRVCMDHIMVDLGSDRSIQKGDTVTLIGKDSGKEIKAEEVAAWVKTIPYEIITRISQNLPRRYLNS